MKTNVKRLAAVFLAVLMLAACFVPTALAALPAGVSEAEVRSLIPKLDKLLNAAMKDRGGLGKEIEAALLSDDLMNGIFTGVYKAMAEQQSAMNTLGVDIRVQTVKANLYNFPEVQAALGDNTDWNAVLTESFAPRWNLRQKDDLKYALGAVFTPMYELLFTLLCGGRYTLNAVVAVQGANGYENAVVPLLKTLGVTNIMSQADFTASAKESRLNMFGNVLDMAFTALDAIAVAPVTELSTRLPGLANYLEHDGLKNAVTTLIEPLKVRVGLISLTGVDKLVENTDLFSSASDLTTMLQNVNIGGADLKLPEVRLSELAACGSGDVGNFTPNVTEAFLVIFRWAYDAVKLNKAQIPSLLGSSGLPADALDPILSKSADELLKLLVDLTHLNPAETVLDYAWTTPAYTPVSIPYTEHLTAENFTKMLSEIDGTLSDFLVELANTDDLPTLLGQRIYSSELVTTLMKTLYGALYSSETSAIMSALGVPASPGGVADSISGAYPTVAAALRRYSNWDRVPKDGFFWLQNGSKEGFVNALTAVLRPLRPMLTFLLGEGSITLMDALTVPGSNGYNTAVIPILEALGCESEKIKTYAEYKATAGTDKALTDILDPIAALLDRVVNTPVATVTEILPNLVFFVKTGGLKQCVDNLLYPVKVLLGKLGMEKMLPADLTNAADLDVEKLISGLADNGELSLKLQAPDLDTLVGLGTLEELPSKRTAGGQPANFSYVRANSEQVLLWVLRYVVGMLKSEENSDVLSGLMQQEDDTGGGDMFAMYTGKITEQLKTMTVDETIEWLYDLLFAETPKREKPASEEVEAFEYVEKEDHSKLIRTALIAGGVILFIGLVLILSRINFHDLRERRKYAKKKRREQKEKLRQAVAASKARRAPAKKQKPEGKKRTDKHLPGETDKTKPAPDGVKAASPVKTQAETSAAPDAGAAPKRRPRPQDNPLVDPLSSMRRPKPAAAPENKPQTAPQFRPRPAGYESPEQRQKRIEKENALIKEKMKAQKAQKKEARKKSASEESTETE